MATGVVLLVLASAFVHALWNAILKRTRAPENAAVSMMIVGALSAGAVALVLRPPLPPARGALWCVAAGVLEAGYFVTLARALTRAPLGAVYTTVRGGGLVIAWPISVVLLGERLTLPTAAGTVLVVLGLLSTGAAERPQSGSAEPSLARSLGWAVICALFVGGYHVLYKLALSADAAPAIANVISLGTAALLNLAFLGRVRARLAIAAAREQPVHVIVAGVLAALGFLIFLAAMAKAGAGVVMTLRNTSILFAQLFGAIQGDRPKRLGVLGAAFVTAGAIVLAL